jgi:hypothetical protein
MDTRIQDIGWLLALAEKGLPPRPRPVVYCEDCEHWRQTVGLLDGTYRRHVCVAKSRELRDCGEVNSTGECKEIKRK